MHWQEGFRSDGPRCQHQFIGGNQGAQRAVLEDRHVGVEQGRQDDPKHLRQDDCGKRFQRRQADGDSGFALAAMQRIQATTEDFRNVRGALQAQADGPAQ